MKRKSKRQTKSVPERVKRIKSQDLSVPTIDQDPVFWNTCELFKACYDGSLQLTREKLDREVKLDVSFWTKAIAFSHLDGNQRKCVELVYSRMTKLIIALPLLVGLSHHTKKRLDITNHALFTKDAFRETLRLATQLNMNKK